MNVAVRGPLNLKGMARGSEERRRGPCRPRGGIFGQWSRQGRCVVAAPCPTTLRIRYGIRQRSNQALLARVKGDVGPASDLGPQVPELSL